MVKTMEGYQVWDLHCLENRWTARAVGVRFYHPSSKHRRLPERLREQFAKLSLRKRRIGSNPIPSASKCLHSLTVKLRAYTSAMPLDEGMIQVRILVEVPNERLIMWKIYLSDRDMFFRTLDEAMNEAKLHNEFVTITNGDMEFVGKFGYDEVKDKTLPNGEVYDWTMRRDETHRSSRKKLV
jgi:hypothetical protein